MIQVQNRLNPKYTPFYPAPYTIEYLSESSSFKSYSKLYVKTQGNEVQNALKSMLSHSRKKIYPLNPFYIENHSSVNTSMMFL